MTAPNPKRQKAARALLDRLFAEASNVWVIHYSCESFYDRPNGASPRITSIAVRNLHSAQTHSFSIHQVAERRHVAVDQIEAQYDALERQMLDEFYAHIGGYRTSPYLHWNMRDINYGFAAIEHRYRTLGGNPTEIADDKKVDLARLLIDIYGVGYTGHPRLETLIAMNKITPPGFLTGREEADAFDARNYVGLHQSTLRKVDVIANLAGRAHDRDLKTNTTWWEMHGGRIRSAITYLAEHPIFIVVGVVASILGLVFSIWPISTMEKWFQ